MESEGYNKSSNFEHLPILTLALRLIDVLAADCLWKSHFAALQMQHLQGLRSIASCLEFEFLPSQQRIADGHFPDV